MNVAIWTYYKCLIIMNLFIYICVSHESSTIFAMEISKADRYWSWWDGSRRQRILFQMIVFNLDCVLFETIWISESTKTFELKYISLKYQVWVRNIGRAVFQRHTFIYVAQPETELLVWLESIHTWAYSFRYGWWPMFVQSWGIVCYRWKKSGGIVSFYS